MWHFTLRGFTPFDVRQIHDLNLQRESSFETFDLSAAKQRLSEWIVNHVLAPDMFYRFEGACGQAKIVVSFYLFGDRRMCPVRIWNRTELFGQAAPGAKWMVDFNGIPPWSAINGVEPFWHPVGSNGGQNSSIGRSARDWRKRACWVIELPEVGLEEIAS
jgi:hypothetical protein